MRDVSLGFIATSQEILDQARELARRMGQKLVLVLSGLEEALAPGYRMLDEEGVEVIISRRGTAHMLRAHLSIPVVSLPDSSMNMLKTIRDASKLSKRLVFTFFHKSQPDLSLFEEILGVEILPVTYHDTHSLEQALTEAKTKGYKVVVGGGVTKRLAKRHGLNSVLLQMPDETIVAALEDARNIALSRREEVELNERYRTILDAVSDGILAVDKTGLVTTINRAARQVLKIHASEAGDCDIAKHHASSAVMEVVRTGRPVVNKLETIGKSQYIVNSVPVLAGEEIVGGVSTFHEASNLMKAENAVRRALTRGLRAKYRLEDYCHRSKAVADIIHKVRIYAACDSSVLITGETGTGKEIIAHGIHLASKRKKGPFVSINCSALPDQLLESELFGYEEGSFTGSRRGGKVGLFELAHGGTIFLDEIGSTPMNVQTHLLRVLQEKEVMRLGGDTVIPINTRVVAATNRSLSEEVREGRLREDLYFRLNVLPVTLPPLRDRPEDVPPLFKRLVSRAETRYGHEHLEVPKAFVNRLCGLPWPGNVRQLEHFIERLVVLCVDGFNAGVFDELYEELAAYPQPATGSPPRRGPANVAPPAPEADGLTREQVERSLAAMGNSKSRAAQNLGVSRTTLWRRMRQWGLSHQKTSGT